MNRDPREVFSEVLIPATEYVVHDAIGPDLHLKTEGNDEGMILTKEKLGFLTNPLLEELGLFDRATIERRTSRAEVRESTPIVLPLIVAITKASREDTRGQVPSVFAHGKSRTITLEHALQGESEEE
jgi:hypothetical protein